MHDFPHRIAIASLAICGALTAFASLETIDAIRSVVAAAGTLPLLLLQHWRFMMGLLGAGLVLAAFIPSLRLPVISAAALSKMAFAAIAFTSGLTNPGQWPTALIELAWVALLLSAGTIFLLEARQEARWERHATVTARRAGNGH